MSEPAELADPAAPRAPDSAVDEITRGLNISPTAARALVAAGYATLEQIRGLSEESLRDVGLDTAEIGRVRTASEAAAPLPPIDVDAAPAGRPAVDGDKIVGRWLDTVRKSERPKRRHLTLPAKDSTDVLRRWVDGDDRAMEAW
ncbi:MAG TPA: hypothetical protein VIZ68_04245, partial [Thermoplasmata archaeon]